MTKVYNFSAGPAVLPKEVIKKAQDELTSFKGSQMSVMEISHLHGNVSKSRRRFEIFNGNSR